MSTENIVNAIIADDKEAFQQAFTQELNAKLADEFNDQRIALANQLYNGVEDEAE